MILTHPMGVLFCIWRIFFIKFSAVNRKENVAKKFQETLFLDKNTSIFEQIFVIFGCFMVSRISELLSMPII